jgi:hypothetical protein
MLRCRSLTKLTLHLGIAARTPVLALTAVLLAGSAPAGAVGTHCTLGVTTICFAEDVLSYPNFPSSAEAETEFQMLIGAGNFDFEGFETGFADKDDPDPVLEIFKQDTTLSIIGLLSDSVPSGGSIRLAPIDDEVNRGFETGGSFFWKNETTSDANNQLFHVAFKDALGVSNVGVRSFGFYATAWSTQSTEHATDLELVLFLEGGGTTILDIPHNETGNLEGSVLYYGVISDAPFIAAALRNSTNIDGGDRIGFDGFTVAIVPEPSTGLLLAAGLLGLAMVGRRRSA